jgi:hypothetical protein
MEEKLSSEICLGEQHLISASMINGGCRAHDFAWAWAEYHAHAKP